MLGGGNLIQLVQFIVGARFGKAAVVCMNDRRMTYTNDSPGQSWKGNQRRERKCLKKRKNNNSWESYETYVEEQDNPD